MKDIPNADNLSKNNLLKNFQENSIYEYFAKNN